MKIEPWLSPLICMGVTDIPSSSKRNLIQTACQLQSDSAMYSASVLDKATVFCARDCHEKAAPAIMKKKSVCEHRLILSDAQSESVKAINPLLLAPSNTIDICLVVLRYRRMCFATSMCLDEGLALNCAILMTANEISGCVPSVTTLILNKYRQSSSSSD
jgi:hypothetical protein